MNQGKRYFKEKHKKKKLSLIIFIMLLIFFVCNISGIYSYFTDEKHAKNVFSLKSYHNVIYSYNEIDENGNSNKIQDDISVELFDGTEINLGDTSDYFIPIANSNYSKVEFNIDGNIYNVGDSYITSSSDVNIIQNYYLKKYTIEFYANDGSDSKIQQYVRYGADVELKENSFVRNDYSFVNWNTKEDGTGISYSNKQIINNLANENETIILYAQWSLNEYTIEFNANGGSGTMTDQKVLRDKNVELSENLFIRDGYEFLNWNTEADGSGTTYSNKQLINNICDIGETKTLFAQWSLNEYIIKFNSNGGTGADMPDQVVLVGSTTKLSKSTYTKGTTLFDRWTTNADGTGTGFLDEAWVEDIAQKGETITLYAQYATLEAYFKAGENINVYMKQLAGDTSPTVNTINTTIKEIKYSENKADDAIEVQNGNSNTPIYMWFDNGTIYWYSLDRTPKFLQADKYFCKNLAGLENFDSQNLFDTSEAKEMWEFFYGCSSLKSIDLGNWDIKNVTNISGFFSGCTSLENVNLNAFNSVNLNTTRAMFQGCTSLKNIVFGETFTLENVTEMRNMFDGCTNLVTVDFSLCEIGSLQYVTEMFRNCSSLKIVDFGNNFGSDNITTLLRMFQGCTSLEYIDLSKIHSTKVDTIALMFAGCTSLKTVNLNGFITSSLTNMQQTFYGCSSLTTLDISSLDISNVTNTNETFRDCTSLVTIYANAEQNFSSSTNSNNMFHRCLSLVGGDGTVYNDSKKNVVYAHVDDATNGNPGYFTLKEY